ncbi:YdaS family helix-turn-helix protein [Klebsiella pneumoniae]|jgi:hypothetical protein|nr:MAG TPA: Putative antitoxin of bacterial toxin-antitoxin system, YdaS/YdaT [Caudoviricetes sp.]
MNIVRQVVDSVGGQTAAAKICGVSPVAVHKWVKRGCLPRTDFTGKTTYARKLAAASSGAFSEGQLLSEANPDRNKA